MFSPRGSAGGGHAKKSARGAIARLAAAATLEKSPRAKFLRNFSKRSAKNAAKFWRNFSQIFVLQFPGKMAAKNFTKNPRHFPRCTKLSFFTAATLGASGPKNAIFSMLRCSFTVFRLLNVQLLVKLTSALQKSQCCGATSAVQPSENCSATSVFACGMLQGWGLEGWGLGVAECCKRSLQRIVANERLQTNYCQQDASIT